MQVCFKRTMQMTILFVHSAQILTSWNFYLITGGF